MMSHSKSDHGFSKKSSPKTSNLPRSSLLQGTKPRLNTLKSPTALSLTQKMDKLVSKKDKVHIKAITGK